MDGMMCDGVMQWLQNQGDVSATSAHLAALRAHIEGCPVCEKQLQEHVAAQLALPVSALTTPCHVSRADLAAYLDIEHEEGVEQARQSFPHVWWHVLTCDDCYEIYHLTQALLLAEQQEDLAPLPVTPAGRPVSPMTLPGLRIPRHVFSQVFAMPSTLGFARGGSEDAFVLSEVECAHGWLSVRVDAYGSEHPVLIVAVEPARPGVALLTIGTSTFRMPLDPQGEARLPGIPTSLLAAASGPDLDVVLEPDQ